MEALLPAARLQGVLGGVVRAEVADRLPRDRAVRIGGADVVAGCAAQHLQGQALADAGQGLVADGFGSGLFSTQRCRCERKGHGFLLLVEDREHHALTGADTSRRVEHEKHPRRGDARPRWSVRSGLDRSTRRTALQP